MQIHISEHQGDGLSNIPFDCILGKVNPTRVGNKSKGVELSCLVFANDFVILAYSEEKARKQVENLREVAEKISFQIFTEIEIILKYDT